MKYGLDPQQLRVEIIRPTLSYLNLHNAAAENLVLGTALQESALIYIRQIHGPALGLWQMEPATHSDIWQNYLNSRSTLSELLGSLVGRSSIKVTQLLSNLAYACAMCRIQYLRVPDVLPIADNALAMAAYWKKFYNTPLGAGSVDKALPHFTYACTVQS